MSLLESLTRAASEADAGNITPLPKFPIILNSDAIFPNLQPTTTTSPTAIKGLTGWSIPETDTSIADMASKLSKTLNRKIKSKKSLNRADFLGFLNSFFEDNAEKIRVPIDCHPSDPNFTRVAIEKVGFLLGSELAASIADCCIILELWGVLETVILQGLIGNLTSTNLIAQLVEKNRPDLLCLCVERIPDLRSSDLLSILKCFLSPSRDCYASMIVVRKRWEGQTLLAIEKATQKGVPKKISRLAKEASVLLMMAHDGFSSAELCLHSLFGFSDSDGMVLASAVSRLDGVEVLRLVRYLVKWLEKYQGFPEAAPCPTAESVLGLRACAGVPSLETVARMLGLVLDEHYSYLVLNSKFHDELRAMERVVSALALEARSYCPVDDIIKDLQTEGRPQRGLWIAF